MNKIFFAIIGLVTISFAMGCQCGSSSNAVARPAKVDYKTGPYYFNNAQKVDNDDIGPKMYRLENDEVVCYTGGSQGGLQCKWKITQ